MFKFLSYALIHVNITFSMFVAAVDLIFVVTFLHFYVVIAVTEL
jgi:hypothetical protein